MIKPIFLLTINSIFFMLLTSHYLQLELLRLILLAILLLRNTIRIRRTPAAAESFNKQDGGVQAPAADADGRSFICQRNSLSSNDIQVTDNPRLV